MNRTSRCKADATIRNSNQILLKQSEFSETDLGSKVKVSNLPDGALCTVVLLVIMNSVNLISKAEKVKRVIRTCSVELVLLLVEDTRDLCCWDISTSELNLRILPAPDGTTFFLRRSQSHDFTAVACSHSCTHEHHCTHTTITLHMIPFAIHAKFPLCKKNRMHLASPSKI